MLRKLLRCKIHRATVTGADPDYEGSITLDQELMEQAGLLPYEAVQVYNVTNGNRFETYVIPGPRHSGEVKINGAAAHLAGVGDLVIIACYGYVPSAELQAHKPTLIFVDRQNRVIRKEIEAVLPHPAAPGIR